MKKKKTSLVAAHGSDVNRLENCAEYQALHLDIIAELTIRPKRTRARMWALHEEWWALCEEGERAL